MVNFLIIDEMSMVRYVLPNQRYIAKTAERLKILLVGDSNQCIFCWSWTSLNDYYTVSPSNKQFEPRIITKSYNIVNISYYLINMVSC